jgi:hypothetical protein
MKKRIIRISLGVLSGLLVLAGVIWLLSLTLGDHAKPYAGKPLGGWVQQLDSGDVGASNQAYAALNARIIPRLVDQMFHDTNDSKLRLSLIETLNSIPGVQINFTESAGRRSLAAHYLGSFGPPAKAAVPFLIRALKGPDVPLHEPAIKALGQIHSDPGVVIPLLIPLLTDDNLNDEAASALGNYGSLAKEAFPKIVPLLKAKDRDARAAARDALKKIDPEAAAKAGAK